MRTVSLTLVFQDGSVPTDGSAPLEPTAQTVAIPKYTDCRINLVCLKSDGTPYDISAGALILSAKASDNQTTPDLSLEADIDDGPGGLAHFIVGSVNSGAMAVAPYNYVIIFDDPSGYLWPPVKQGTLAINPTDYTPGQDVTVPESQQPLAQGPPGVVWRGVWSSVTTYHATDGVKVLDPSAGNPSRYSSFRSKGTNTNQPPIDGAGVLNSAFWEDLARCGENGDTVGTGTVTRVATDATLVGGPITDSGTLGLNLDNPNEWAAEQTFDDALVKLLRMPPRGDARKVIYVRTDGNDSTGDGALGNPYRTIPRAQEDVPVADRTTRYVIDFTGLNDTIDAIQFVPSFAGGRTWYDIAAAPDWGGFAYEGDLNYQAIPQSVLALDPGTTQVVDPVTFNMRVTDATKTWTPGEWRGYLYTGNIAAGEVGTILDNDGDSLLVEAGFPFSGALSIYDYGATLTAAVGVDLFSISDQFAGVIAFNGVRLVAQAGATSSVLCTCPVTSFYASCSYLDTLEMISAGVFRGFHVTIASDFDLGCVDNDSIIGGLLLGVSFSPATSGVFISGAMVNCPGFPSSSSAASQRRISIAAIDLIDSGLVVENAVVDVDLFKSTNAPGDVFRVGALGRLLMLQSIRDGGGNVGVGLRLVGGSAEYDATDVPTVTGGGGDVIVGLQVVAAWGDIAAEQGAYDVLSGSLIAQQQAPAVFVAKGTAKTFRYTIQGGDGTDFTVAIPAAARLGDDYGVSFDLATEVAWTPIAFPLADRDGAQFRCVTSDAYDVGTVLEFTLTPVFA